MPSPGDNYAIHKVSVRRARQACGPCRRKKARCPGEKPVCSLCQRLGQRCSYSSQSTSGPGTGSARRLDEPHDEGQAEGAGSQRLQRIERRLEEMAGILQESLSRGGKRPHADLQSYYCPGRLGTDGPADPLAAPNEDRAHGTLGLSDFVRSQVDVYLAYFHDQPYCVFAKEWLLSRASSLPPEIAFPLVALTSRLSLYPRGMLGSNVPSAEYWVGKAWDTLTDHHKKGRVGLSFLQGTCLMAQVDFADGRGHRAYTSCALGIRTLQSAGLNRDLFASDLDSSSLEERRRITWAFFMLDRTYGASRGYSICLADKYFSLAFPSPDLEESSPSSSHIEPENEGEVVENSILACLIRLFALWGKATEYVFDSTDEKALSPWQSGSAFAVLESEWMQFETQFPNSHRYLNVESELRAGKESRNGLYLPTWLCVQFLLHSIQCMLHHPFVIMIKLRHINGNLSSTFLQKSFESSLLHSRWIARLIKEMSDAGSRPYDPFLAYLAAIAATIQLEHTVSSNPEVARLVTKEFQILTDFMKHVSVHWANIRVLVDRVGELARRRRNFGSLYYNQDGYSGALPTMPTPSNLPKMSTEDEALMWDILEISSSSCSSGMAQLGDLVPSFNRQTIVPSPEQPPSPMAPDVVEQGKETNDSMQPDLSAPEMSLLDGRVLALMAEDPAGWSFPDRSNGDEFGNAIPDVPDWMMSSGHLP